MKIQHIDEEISKLLEVDSGRRGFLRGIAAFAAASAMPSSLVSALASPEGIATLNANDAEALLKAIQKYLPRYDQEDWTGTFERWDNMAAALHIYGDDDEVGADKLARLLKLYKKNPEKAVNTFLQHLKNKAVDLTDVRKQTIDQWDDIETVRQSDTEGNADYQKLQKDIADYLASTKKEKLPGPGQIQTATIAAEKFRDIVQKAMNSDNSTEEPAVKDMGKIEPTSSLPALPAPDKSAAELMRDLQNIVDRPLTDQEKEIVKQEIKKENND